jgi:hypothetical protein
MTTEVCPYCRGSITDQEPLTVCDGCGTRHHADCYAENGGCTIFGCRCAPAEEPKLLVSVPELISVATAAPVVSESQTSLPPPPPPPGRDSAPPTVDELQQITNRVVPSMFGSFAGYDTAPEPEPVDLGPPKSRTTYIVLGALLGAFGAHNFYAGYTKKAGGQLAITLLTLGFGSPMSWIWAIIDICTIGKDSRGVQFES